MADRRKGKQKARRDEGQSGRGIDVYLARRPGKPRSPPPALENDSDSEPGPKFEVEPQEEAPEVVEELDGEKPTDEEHAVAKHLRFNLAQKEAKLVGMTVKVFIASEAVDMLLESKWSSSKGKGDNILFTNRSSCTKYMDRLLQKGLFHRALRVEKKKKNSKEDVDETNAEEKVRRRKVKKDQKPEKVLEKEKEKEKEESEKKDKDKDDKKKKEKKMKLKMHDDQFFCDGEEVFVWIYDPVNVKTFIIGLFLVLGSIGVCLFPLWPPEVRQGVYYLSLAAAAFVGFILVLAIIRSVMFCIIWAVTMGKHHFWLFPNLMEDVGIIDSFKPLYKHDFMEKEKKEKTDEKDSKTEKDKNSDNEKDKSGDSSGSEENFEIVDKSEVTETEDSQAAE
ncbi:translocation protein SEC62-like [Lineus longissimus]|uniref:translocation protein SEC62-like n=1 Tax=Lineus longissimus TaxID=88925 RepID=UPI00315C865A